MAGKINEWAWRFPNRARWRVRLTRPGDEPKVVRCAWRSDFTEGTPPRVLVHFDVVDKAFGRQEEQEFEEFLSGGERWVVLARKKLVAGKPRVDEVTNLYVVRPVGSTRSEKVATVTCEIVGGRL